MNDHDLTKQPKWVQQHVERLERDVQYLRDKLNAVVEGKVVEDWRKQPAGIGLWAWSEVSSDARVTWLPYSVNPIFVLRNNWGAEELLGKVEIRHRGDHLDITSLGTTVVDGLSVQPQSSNRFKVTFAERLHERRVV